MNAPASGERGVRRSLALLPLALLVGVAGALAVVAVVLHGRWRAAEADRAVLTDDNRQTTATLEALRDEKIKSDAAYNARGIEKQTLETKLGDLRDESEQLNIALGRARDALTKAAATRDRLTLDRDKIIAGEYGRTILLAHTRFREGDIVGARTLLDETRNELRAWEWHYLNQLLTPRPLPVVDPRLHHIRIRDGSLVTVLKGENLDVGYSVFSPDRKRIVTISGDRISIDRRDKTARVWDAQSGTPLAVLAGHTAVISTVLWTPDGTRIVTGSADKSVRVWDSNTGKELLSLFKGHQGGITSASFNAAGSRILTTSADGTARVWDANTREELLILCGPTNAVPQRDRKNAVTYAAYNPKGSRIVTAGWEDTDTGVSVASVTVWDATTGKQLLTFKVPGFGSVSSLAWSNDGKRIVTGNGHAAIVWDADTGKAIFTLKPNEKQRDLWDVITVAFSPDDSHIATGCRLGFQVWDAKTGELFRTHDRDGSDVRAVLFRPKGMRLALEGSFKEVKVKDTEAGTLVTLKGHTDSVVVASFSLDGQFIVTGSRDQTARVWDATTGKALFTLKGHTRLVTSASYSADGLRIVTGSEDGTTRVWDAKTGAHLFTLPGHGGDAGLESISPDGSRILTDSMPHRVWDITTGKQLATIAEWTRSLGWSRDGKRLLGHSGENTTRVWDAATGKELFALKGYPVNSRGGRYHSESSYSADGTRILTTGNENGGSVARVWDATTGEELGFLKAASVQWGPRGRVLMGTNPDGTVGVWDAGTGASVVAVLRHPLPLQSPVWSPDGSRIMTATRDGPVQGLVQVWDATTGRRLATFTGAEILHDRDDRPVFPGTWSPDGNSVRTTTGIWDINPGPQRFDLRGHTGTVHWAEWSHDARRVVTASEDHTASVWDARTGEPLLVLRGHTSTVQSAAWSHDGKSLVTASGDGTVRVWDAATGAERLVLKVLTQDTYRLSTASFSPNGSRVLTVGAGIQVWDATTGDKVAVLEGAGDLRSARWTADGKRIVPAGWGWESFRDTWFGVWDAATGKRFGVWDGKNGTWSTKGLTGLPDVRPEETHGMWHHSSGNTVHIWSRESNKELAVLKGHTGEVKYAEWSPSGKQIVTCSADNTARVWNATTGKELAVLKGHTNTVWRAFWSSDGTRIATASGDNSTRIWDARSGTQIGVLKHPHSLNFWGDKPDSLSWSPDGRRILTRTTGNPDEYGGHVTKIVHIWDVETGDEVAYFWGHTPPPDYGSLLARAKWTADGTRFVTEGRDRTVREWDARTGNQLAFVRRVPKSEYANSAVGSQWQGGYEEDKRAKSPDGSRTITYFKCGGGLEMYNARTGDVLVTLAHSFYLGGPDSPRLLWSPDGKRVLIDRELVDVETGTPLATLPSQVGRVGGWSADSTRFATAGDDGTVQVWDGKTGVELLTLQGEPPPQVRGPQPAEKPRQVTAVEWSPDGRQLLVLYDKGVAWVWDSQTREWPPRLFPEAPAPRATRR